MEYVWRGRCSVIFSGMAKCLPYTHTTDLNETGRDFCTCMWLCPWELVTIDPMIRLNKWQSKILGDETYD